MCIYTYICIYVYMCVCQKSKALNLSDYIYIYSNSVIYKCFINQQTDIPIFSSLLNVKHQKNLS